MLRKISIIVALIVLIVNVRLSGDCFGFEQGYQFGVKTFTEIRGGEGTAYLFLFEQYASVVSGIFFFLIGKTIKKETLSQIICIPSLLLTLRAYYYVYIQKSVYFADVEPFSELIRKSMPFDVVCFTIVSMLLIYQLGTVLKLLFSNNQKVSKMS